MNMKLFDDLAKQADEYNKKNDLSRPPAENFNDKMQEMEQKMLDELDRKIEEKLKNTVENMETIKEEENENE